MLFPTFTGEQLEQVETYLNFNLKLICIMKRIIGTLLVDHRLFQHINRGLPAGQLLCELIKIKNLFHFGVV